MRKRALLAETVHPILVGLILWGFCAATVFVKYRRDSTSAMQISTYSSTRILLVGITFDCRTYVPHGSFLPMLCGKMLCAPQERTSRGRSFLAGFVYSRVYKQVWSLTLYRFLFGRIYNSADLCALTRIVTQLLSMFTFTILSICTCKTIFISLRIFHYWDIFRKIVVTVTK